LLIIPAGDGRARQQELTRAVIAWIANAAADSGQTSAQFMIDNLVEIDSDGLTVAYDLPSD
jgi:hypothetical protein